MTDFWKTILRLSFSWEEDLLEEKEEEIDYSEEAEESEESCHDLRKEDVDLPIWRWE